MSLTDDIYDDLKTMFMSNGWNYFLEDVKENLKGVNTLSDIQGEQQLGMKQGQVAILQGIIKYEDTIDQVRQQAQIDAEQDDTGNEALEL